MSDHEAPVRVVVGRAPDLQHARTIFEELQHHGVDAADLKLGAADRGPEHHTRGDGARGQPDVRTVDHVGRRVGGGAVVGALGGGLVGAIGGFLVTSGDVGSHLTLFLVVTLVFAALGAWVAATVTATRSMGYDDTWQLTFDDATRRDDGTWVAVRVHDDTEVAEARDVFAQEGITTVEEHLATTHGERTVRW
jgi:hypothetical protein